MRAVSFALIACLGLVAAAPAFAQSSSENSERLDSPQMVQPQPASTPVPRPGSVVHSSAGEVGKRLVRQPLGRIDNRVQNRVQSRIRNRIDRYYDPEANMMSPFEAAGEQARKNGKPKRR